MKTIIIRKFFSVLLSFLLAVQPVMVPVVVYAEDVLPSDPGIGNPAPTEAPKEEASPPTSSSTITTGDSAAEGTQEVTANKTEITASGSVSVDGCSVDVNSSCPVNLTNDATVESSATVDATSGGNTILDVPGDALEKTGSASALAVSQTELNTTVIALTGPTGTSGATGASALDGPTGASGISGPTGSSGTGGVNIKIDNAVDLHTEASASAVSGQNTEKNIGGNAVIATGGSCASAYSLNIINTTILGSSVRFLVISIDSERVGDINLNDLWKDIQKEQNGKKTLYLDGNGSAVDITNSSSSFVRVAASAVSGDNAIERAGGDGTIMTGDAFASAGLVNFQNTTVIGSQILVVIINIIGSLKGNIIVPSGERFIEGATKNVTAGLPGVSQINLSDSATVSGSMASVIADTGNNTSIGPSLEQYTQTGNAYAQANEFMVANMDMYVDYLYKILFNNYGYHQGGVDGLTDPEGTTPITPFSSSSFIVADGSDFLFRQSEGLSGETTATIINSADASFDVDVLAKTGGNNALDINGKTTVKTGTAVAIAHILSFFNTTIFGNSLFFPIINILGGKWFGDLVFERPDMTVQVTASADSVLPDSEVEYRISYANSTGEDARNVAVAVSLPPDLSFVSASLTSPPEISGTTYVFSIGSVAGHASGSFLVRVHVSPSINPDDTKPTAFFQRLKRKIIPVVMAADREKLEIVRVGITTSDRESDSKNNQTSVTTKVIIPEIPASVQSGSSSYEVALTIASANNAGNFVYPGEIIHFTVTLTNSGSSLAKDVSVTQTLYTGDGRFVGSMNFPLETVLSRKTKVIDYDLTVPIRAGAGVYVSKSTGVGFDESGKKIETGEAQSSFTVRLKQPGIVGEVQAAEEVKGAETVAQPPCVVKKDYIPYILVTALLILWFVEFMRRRRIEKESGDFRKLASQGDALRS